MKSRGGEDKNGCLVACVVVLIAAGIMVLELFGVWGPRRRKRK